MSNKLTKVIESLSSLAKNLRYFDECILGAIVERNVQLLEEYQKETSGGN